MKLDNPALADAVAAQYVLGVLPSRVRARFAALLGTDRRLEDAVRAWEARLLPLAEAVAPVPPPSRVWARIRQAIESEPGAAEPPKLIWENLGLWRGLALAGFATALAFAVVVFSPPAERPEQTLVVVLAAQDAKPALIASAERSARTLLVKAVAPLDVGADRTLELWALPPSGNPRSLGLVPASGVARIALPATADAAFAGIPALAVSLEPRGGSPTGLPTGPVLFSGPVQRLY